LTTHPQIQLMSFYGSDRTTLTNAEMGVVDFVWSPVEEKIAYCKGAEEGGAMIAVVNADESERKRFVGMGDVQCFLGVGHSVDWSPDGERIAFTSIADGKRAVGVMGKDGQNPKPIVLGYGALWSPNGKQLLFRHDSDSSPVVTSIWIVNDDGTHPRRVLNDERANYGLAWFPDGKSIVFASDRESKHESEIFRINADGTGLQKIASREGLMFLSPVFSPDGAKLVVECADPWRSTHNKHDSSIWLLDLASHSQELLAKGSYAGILWEEIPQN